ncbi:hypothetical protein RBS60_10965 [Sinomonas sp. ASV486]|uniref:hypothetical protein n=1 Tax=Sinomonas sp. ASV486 TaxID=3051170 RepID=UPI0027DCD5BD|nr:hypothetical protein [Sinomonas sp. ASV486]MDQ4490718.1 hypothetical protein [Sinomonas sp. ASV486]
MIEALAQSGSGLRQLHLMTVLGGFEPTVDHQVEIGDLEADPSRWGFTDSSLGGDLEALQSRGWIEFWPTYSGIGSVVLKQPGIDAAREFQQLQTDPVRRYKEARDALLRWLYEANLSGSAPSGVQDFLLSPTSSYLGSQYTEDEVRRAADWLLEKGYIKGHRTYVGSLLRPSITSAGIDAVETVQSASAALTGAGITVNNINVTGSQGVNLSVASSHVNQSNTLTQNQVDEVAKVIDSARALLNSSSMGISRDAEAEARGVVDDLDEEIQQESPRTGIIKGLVAKLADLAATGTVQWAVDAFTALTQHAIGMM